VNGPVSEDTSVNTTSRLRRAGAIAIVTALGLATGGCGFVNKLVAKDKLNNGARAFNRGHYDEAETYFKGALDYDPENPNALLFYAMTKNAEFKRQTNEENGMAAIDAYQKLIDSPLAAPDKKDKAHAFIAEVYRGMAETLNPSEEMPKIQGYRDKRREWLLKRVNLPDQSPEVQAEMLYAIGQGYWEEANFIIKAHQKQGTDPREGPQYEVPEPEKSKALDLIRKGHEYLQQAISKNPKYAFAYAYEKILYSLENRITTDPARKQELLKKANEAEEKFRQVNAENQAAAAQEPPAEEGQEAEGQ
jgi:tetratricopeptide (TPR) repeat protein